MEIYKKPEEGTAWSCSGDKESMEMVSLDTIGINRILNFEESLVLASDSMVS